MGIILPKYRQKPRLGAKINWEHPLALGLNQYYLINETGGGTICDIAGERSGALTGSPSWGPNFLNFDGTNDVAAVTPVAGTDGFGDQITIAFRARRTAAQPDSAFGTVIAKTASTGQVPYAVFLRTAGARLRLNTVSDDATGNVWDTTADGFPVGSWVTAAYTWVNGGTPVFYINGKVQSYSSSGGTLSGSLKSTTQPLYIGAADATPSSLRLRADLDWLLVSKRAFGSAEISLLSEDPYTLIQPPIYRRYFDLGGNTPVTVNPSPLTGTYSIPSPSVTANVTISPLALTGTYSIPSTSVSLGITLTPSTLVGLYSMPQPTISIFTPSTAVISKIYIFLGIKI